jgi:hypothetical protein
MKYRGFREETLLVAGQELEGLGLKPSEVHAVMNLAGAKWRAVQVQEGRGNESQDEEDSQVFHEATVSVMQSTMTENMQLVNLLHAAEGERFMFLAISLTLSRLFSRGPRSIRKWLRAGDKKAREVTLAFAIGSSIIIDPRAIDLLFDRIVRFRYGTPFDSGEDVSGPVLAVIGRLGKSGYSCLNPITDTTT